MIAAPLPRARAWMLGGAGAAAFAALWSAAALSGATSRNFLPAPWDVVLRFVDLLVHPFAGYTLPQHLLASLQRFGLGWALAVAVGLPLGLAMARLRWLERIVSPAFDAVRFVAPIAWVPFAALWFGTGIGGPVLIIFTGAFPPVLINTLRGAQQVEVRHIEAARMLGVGHLRMMTEVLLPAAMPAIVAGLRVSAGLGWQSLVGAELIVAASGVGDLLVKGQAAVSTATVMSGMIAIGAVGVVIDVALRRLQRAIESRRGG